MTYLRLLQHRAPDGSRSVILAEGDAAHILEGVTTVRELALRAIAAGETLAQAAKACPAGPAIDIAAEFAAGRLLAPIDHDDPAHLLMAGTGLTHLGSAEGRDKMHKAATSGEHLTDSMRIFLEGLEGGKPAPGETGQQPEWFYKGDGSQLVGPTDPFTMPSFAQDGGEEPEVAGIYIIGEDGTPYRLGLAIANEFSDHVTERHNYLWLAHSKLRQASLGAELLIGQPPENIEGTSRILRDGKVIWEKPFLSGEANMSHTLANLENHHFKYDLFRRPGDVHVHFFGTATLSFSDGIATREGDVFEISASPFTLPVANPLARAEARPVAVKAL
ncbi:AraD1 family protein [Novosphingobium mangrovi (ex Huang et al. 2023)]|uniref:GguC family protein n=1 Tax=Novosphingobium mangrovi (ex Huang et al. 2023) TaxID=2976432 RepID=A0ABT2I8P1_9SPHN|nr:AraD1 family protein [Novosphingobium mangrovi (ex Huang et al. 2023)]MCT2401185.1 GguC family protein [Novosphingobium mangrovi (ex Huang et al. 2023)]